MSTPGYRLKRRRSHSHVLHVVASVCVGGCDVVLQALQRARHMHTRSTSPAWAMWRASWWAEWFE
eukprot:49692-Eustigmatos_ZCMA.PRE.1